MANMVVVDNFEDLVKCGYLEVKFPRKHRKFGRQAWKMKWFILRRKSSDGYPRLEFHKSEESCLLNQNKTVVDLRTLMKVEEFGKSKSRKILFKLIFTDTFINLSSVHESDMKEWTRLIRKQVFPTPISRSCIPRPEGSFLVTIIHTEDSERLNLIGDYILVVTPEHLIIYHVDTKYQGSSTVSNWDLDDIPRFRLQKLNQLQDSEKIFIVNVARTSQTGQGEFQFLTRDGRAILEAVKSHTKNRIRNLDDSQRSSPLDLAVSNSTLGIEGDRSRTNSLQSHLSADSNTNTSRTSGVSSESSIEPFPKCVDVVQ